MTTPRGVRIDRPCLSLVLLLHTLAFYYLLIRPGEHVVVEEVISTKSTVSSVAQSCGDNSDLAAAISTGQRLVNVHITEYNATMRNILQGLVSRKVSPRDPDLISLIKEMMDPPSEHMVKVVRPVTETPQSIEALKLLDPHKKGFFVEAGALDGERSSNTIFMEQNKGWTGLLVEVDPFYYTQLLGKKRKAWSINACLSPFEYPIMMDFSEASGGTGHLTENGNNKMYKAPCFPLESLLLALDVSHVDFFSLDVEGFELEVLRTVPFDRIDITVLAVEYVHGKNGKEAYRDFMEGKGYTTHKDIHDHRPQITLYVDDYIFVKNKVTKS